MKFNEISFPVFYIGETKPQEEEGVVFFIKQNQEDVASLRILDDKNVKKSTLSLRRLVLLNMGIKIFKLDRAIFYIGDLIKLSKSTSWFIDNNGKVFKYIKSVSVPLIFAPITKIIPFKHGGAVIEVEKIPTRFKLLFTPTKDKTYAGVLVLGTSYILYGVYNTKLKNTRRKI